MHHNVMTPINSRPPASVDAAAELGRAIERYKRESGRMFPTWSEVLEVVRALGYEKRGADFCVSRFRPAAFGSSQH
ncbi:MAG: hypothetical protein P4L84_16000 [Isosphaeraceae bacterium]|nr:hypothetical protein [Isosphaeraceae bacterium]